MLTPKEAHELGNILQKIMFLSENDPCHECNNQKCLLEHIKQNIRQANDYINVHTKSE